MFSGRSNDAMQPLVFGILRALTPNDIQCTLIDERLQNIDYMIQTDMVVLTVETFTARRSYQIAQQFRERKIPVIMGGFHPTLLPDESLKHADSIVLGDAENSWPKLIEDFTQGKLARIYATKEPVSIANSYIDRRIFSGKRYLPLTLTQFARGCKFNCDFCSIRAFYGNQLQQRNLPTLVRDLQQAPKRHVFFVDDNLFVNTQLTSALLHQIKSLDITWSCQASIDLCRDPELVAQMAESGCKSMLIGFESLDTGSLKQMNKSWNIKEQSYEQSIQILRDHGIMIYGTFVIGYDHDTLGTFKRTLDFAMDQKLFMANFNPLTPTPNTPLYRRLESEGRLLYDCWWLDPKYRYGKAIYVPVEMSPEQLEEGCFEIRKKFISYRSILKRMSDRKANCRGFKQLGVYLVSNIVNRRAILAKQFKPLGEQNESIEIGWEQPSCA
jgi:radical SAM superfamily enzyme YgiQ (UPF0313 family)